MGGGAVSAHAHVTWRACWPIAATACSQEQTPSPRGVVRTAARGLQAWRALERLAVCMDVCLGTLSRIPVLPASVAPRVWQMTPEASKHAQGKCSVGEGSAQSQKNKK